VHDDSGRLVDNEEVLVLVLNPEVHGLRLERRLATFGELHLDVLPALEPEALRAAGAVDADRAGREQALGLGTRIDIRKAGEEAVEPEPGRLVRNAQP
jgi:hypothetical protein